MRRKWCNKNRLFGIKQKYGPPSWRFFYVLWWEKMGSAHFCQAVVTVRIDPQTVVTSTSAPINQFGISACPTMLFLGKKPLTNFGIERVLPLCSPADPNIIEAIHVWLRLTHDRGCVAILDVHAGALSSQILGQLPHCRILIPAASQHLDAYLLDLADAVRKSTAPTVFFREGGLHHLWNGTWVMVTGDETLGDCGAVLTSLSASASALHLVWDSTLPVANAVQAQIKAMERDSKTVQIAFAFALLSSLRSEIMHRGFSTFPVLSVQGAQNFGKTVLVTRQCLLYDIKGGKKVAAKLEPISTEIGLISAISKFRNQVVLVDDLAKGSHPAIERQRLKMMAGILRFAANNSERCASTPTHENVMQECQAGVAFTGEIPFVSPSDRSRVIELFLTKPLRGGAFADRAVAATAFRAWALWFLPNIEEEFSKLNQLCAQAPQVEQARLQQNYILLFWALTSFYRFALECGHIGMHFYESACQAARHTLQNMLKAQTASVEAFTSAIPECNLSAYVLRGYKAGNFHIVARNKIKSRKDCILEQGILCIQTRRLAEFIGEATPYKTLSVAEICKCLEAEGVLAPIGRHKERRHASKKIGGKRYLELPLELLKKSARTY